MPQFLYFFEDAPAGNAELVRQCGLTYALDDSPNWRGAATGPGGVGGQVAARAADGLGYYPERQEWRSLGLRAGRRCWVGWLRGEPPGPADLLTPHALPGHPVRMWDDSEWTVPIAVQCEEGSHRIAIPRSYDIDQDGARVGGRMKSCHERLWQIAQRFWDATIADEAIPISEFTAMAVDVLATNYRLSMHEACALSLFDDRCEVARRVLQAAVDFQTFLDWAAKKKTEEAGG